MSATALRIVEGSSMDKTKALSAELSQIELSSRLEPDDEEEERHQPAVHPIAKIQRDACVADVDRELRPPERVVRRRVDVHPDERGGRRGQQDRRTAGLGAEELPQRRLHAARPGRSSRER